MFGRCETPLCPISHGYGCRKSFLIVMQGDLGVKAGMVYGFSLDLCGKRIWKHNELHCGGFGPSQSNRIHNRYYVCKGFREKKLSDFPGINSKSSFMSTIPHTRLASFVIDEIVIVQQQFSKLIAIGQIELHSNLLYVFLIANCQCDTQYISTHYIT